ncbi:leucine carboxyl methyltransferase 1-like [Babylonia areolata]|uniref:leucine carboxyl methyltransferase 1-like n=1 Tax=Babylonia areolata TaxID=304850 RepID=UPI003FCF1B55
MASEDAVMATNDDAAQCKRFAVDKGYWQDPYISLFVPKGKSTHAPEINKGYYARVTSIRILLQKFIEATNRECQVVSLGAGFDTTYWCLKEQDLNPKSYIEMDFMAVTSRKCQQIKSKKALLDKLATEDGDVMWSKSEVHAGDYHLVSADLRKVGEVEGKLADCGLDKNLPTLFMAECVLVYIEVPHTEQLLRWISENVPTAMFINYEQVNMGDRFGQVMIDNLKTRDCYLHGVAACKSLETQKQRFTSQGWTGATAWDMMTVYKHLPQADLQRIERIEFLDERELLEQLYSHYCLVWAYLDKANVGLKSIHI